MKNTRCFIAVFIAMLFAQSVFAASFNYLGNANGMEGKTFTVSVQQTNLSAQESSYILDTVSTKFAQYISDYMGMSFVNDANTKEFLKRIKDSDSLLSDENSILSANFKSAQYVLFVSVRKMGTGSGARFSIDVKFSNVQTKVTVVTSLTDLGSINDLYSDVVVGKITKTLAQKSGVTLTSVALYALDPKTSQLSTQQQLELNRQKQEADRKREEQIQQSLSSDPAKAAAQKLIYESNKAKAEREQKLLEERLAKELEESKKQAGRSETVNIAIKDFSKQVDEALAKNKSSISTISAEDKIIDIELKKALYVQVRDSIDAQKTAYQISAKVQYEREKKDIDDPKYYPSRAKDSNGNLIMSSESYLNKKAELEKDNADLKAQLYASANQSVSELQKNSDAQLSSLRGAIEADRQKFGKKETSSSLKDNSLFSVGGWNGNAWPLKISIYLGNIAFIEENIILSDKELQSIYALKNASGNLLSFDDAYDVFDSMFRMSVPFFYVEVDYKIEPMADKYPSCYTITPLEYRLINTLNGKVIKKVQPEAKPAGLEYLPQTDIRTITEKTNDYKTDLAKKQKENISMEKTTIYAQRYGGGARSSVGLNLGITTGASTGFAQTIDWTVGWTTWFYTAAVFGIAGSPYNSKVGLDFFQTFGLNARLPLVNWYPNLYFDFGLGLWRIKYDENGCLLNSPSTSSTTSSSAEFTMRYAFGIDFPVANRWAINAQWALFHVPYTLFADEFTVGVRYGQWRSFKKWIEN